MAKLWPPEDERFLRENLNKMSNEDIGMMLSVKRSPAAVSSKIYKMNIRRSPDSPFHGRFTKGEEPWNKGMKGLHFSPDTQFKKGVAPANAQPEGAVRVWKRDRGRKNLYIKIGGKFKLLHHCIWESQNGPIPKKHVIRFKNGDHFDVRLENLECVTRDSIVRRNYDPGKTSKGLKRYWKNNTKMRKQYSRRAIEVWETGEALDSDTRIASFITPDKELQKIVLQCPWLLETKRNQLRLQRAIKQKEVEGELS